MMLTPLELDIMKAVWRRPPITVRDVQENIRPIRNLAYTTVMTIMDRLHHKGFLTRKLRSRTHLYEPAIDYTDVRDVVRAYRLLIEKAVTGEVYNVGSGTSSSGREILDVLRSLSRVPLEIESDPNRVRASEAPEIVAEVAPIRRLTGWQPQIDLKTTLHDTLNFWRACSMSGVPTGVSNCRVVGESSVKA